MPLPVLLTAQDNPTIRQAIRADLGPSQLPDIMIAAAYTTAVSQVVALDANAGAWAAGSTEASRAHDAAVFFAAAFLAMVVPQIVRENFQGYSYAVQPFDPAERASTLRELAVALLAQNLGVDLDKLLRPTMFVVAQGRRGYVGDDSFPGDFRLGEGGVFP